jgi:Na+/melibiose symporter-like transporter
MIGWGLGSFSSASLVSAVGLLHLRFMTDSLGLSIGLAGALVVVSRVYDTVLDPLVGVLSDRTRTRFGRYRPFLIGGGLLAALSMIMLFNVPAALTGAALVAFVTLSLMVFSTAYTLFRIPYLALGRSITQDFTERSRLMTYSVYGSSLGSLAATSAAPFLLSQIGSDRAGHGVIAWILAALIAAGACATFLLIDTEAAPPENVKAPPHASFRQTMLALKENKPFQHLIGFKITMFAGLSFHMNAIPYYTRHVLNVSDAALGSVFLAQTLMMMISQTLWVKVANRFGRRNGLLAAGLIEIGAMAYWFIVPAGQSTPWLQIGGGLSGIAGGGLFFGLYTVLTDTMDYTRRTSGGDGREGILAGVFVMVEKATTAIGTFIFSLVLGWVGYISAQDAGSAVQPAGVQMGLTLAISLIPAGFALVACLFLRGMKLDHGPGGESTVAAQEEPLVGGALQPAG